MTDLSLPAGSSTWFGYARTSSRIGAYPVDIVAAPADRWPAEHQRRLLETRTVAGLVPTLGVRRTYEQTMAHQLPAPGMSLDEAIAAHSLSGVAEITGAVEAAARAVHGGHSLGLQHGALRADDVRILDRKVAVCGMGLGVGGHPDHQQVALVAPEVAAGNAPTAASDVYSLGRVLESSLGPSVAVVSPGLRRLIVEATDTDPSLRPPSALAFAERLRTAAGHKRRWRPFGLAALGSGSAASDLAAALAGTGSDVASSALAAGVGPAASTAIVSAASIPASPSDARDPAYGRRRLAGWALAGAVGAALLGLYALNRGGADDPDADTTAAPGSTIASSTIASTTIVSSTTATAGPAASSTTATAAPAVSAPTSAPPVAQAGGLTAAQAGGSFEILHALPATAVDAYLEGQLAAAGFTPGTLAGPLPLTDAGRGLQLYVAVEEPPAAAADRDDAVVLDTVLRPIGPGTMVVFLGLDGVPRLEPFVYDLGPVPAGQARLALQHVASTGPVSIAVDGTTVVSGLNAGGSHAANVVPGTHRVQVTAADGTVLLDQVVDAPEGQLTSAWIRGGADEGFTTSIRRIAGLATAPTGIPSGNSGLAPDHPSNGLVASLITMVGLSALGMAWHRRWLRTSPVAPARGGEPRR